jgi:hypothetical protein
VNSRFLGAFAAAIVVAFFVFWIGAWLAGTISTPHTEHNDFTVGQKMMLCGRVVDTRHQISGYDYDLWQGGRCNDLSELDECLLDCLSRAGTIPMGEACYADCVQRPSRADRSNQML